MLKNKKLLLILTVIIITGLLAAGCGQAASTGQGGKEPYKIGAVFDSSGPASSLGVPERDTAQMVVDEINNKGGINGHPIELIMLDSKSNETEAALAAKKLIQQGVSAIIGASTSGTTMAMIDIVQNAKIPLVSAAASVKIVEPVKERQWVFKMAQSDQFMAEKLIDYLKTKKITKVAMAISNNAYGDSGRIEFEKAAANNGITILAMEKFEQNDTSMTPQITNIKKAEPEAVICWSVPPSASVFTANFRQMGLTVPLLHSGGIANKTFLDLAGPAAEGVVFPVGRLPVAEQLPDNDPQKAVELEYAKAFETKYGTGSRSTFGGHAWDAVKIIAQAMEKAGSDPAKLRDEIEKISFTGVSSVFNFSPEDHGGITKDALVLVEVRDGKWSLIK